MHHIYHKIILSEWSLALCSKIYLKLFSDSFIFILKFVHNELNELFVIFANIYIVYTHTYGEVVTARYR